MTVQKIVFHCFRFMVARVFKIFERIQNTMQIMSDFMFTQLNETKFHFD